MNQAIVYNQPITVLNGLITKGDILDVDITATTFEKNNVVMCSLKNKREIFCRFHPAMFGNKNIRSFYKIVGITRYL